MRKFMYTKTLENYLKYIQRMPYVNDLATIRQSFQRNRLRLTDELLDFQLRYAGYFHGYSSYNVFIYGLLHEHSAYLPILDIDFDDEYSQELLITCMDCYPSDARALSLKGVYYEDYIPVAESFTKYLEQRAFWWQISQENQWQEASLSEHIAATILEEQAGKLAEFYLPLVSDQYTQTYQLDKLIIKINGINVNVWKIAGSVQQLFYFNL